MCVRGDIRYKQVIIMKRDDWCARCGSKHNLCVHHIKHAKGHNKASDDSYNLVTLCFKCHMKFHKLEKHGKMKHPHRWCRSFNNRLSKFRGTYDELIEYMKMK